VHFLLPWATAPGLPPDASLMGHGHLSGAHTHAETFKRAVRSSVARIRQHGQARGGGGIRWSRVLQHVSLLADLYLLYRLPEIMRAVGRVVGRRGDCGTTEFRRRRTYVVREGDTLSKIARRHRIKLPTLLSKNEGLRSEHFIRVGERLFL
jgi:hypothetical protein